MKILTLIDRNNMKLVFQLLIITLIVSCSNTGKVKDISNDENDIRFEDFSTNPDYQLSHIQFPLQYYSLYILDNEELSLISKSNWRFIDFSKDDQAQSKEVDAFNVLLEKQTPNMIYKREGIDNGMYIEYHFMLKNSDWTLVKILDKSS
ncbi:MAG: hypothetical protein AAF363_06530 [Bacteroidota bacterium]